MSDRSVNERLASIETMVKEIHEEVKGGSGRKGLIERVSSLENWRSGLTACIALIAGWLKFNKGA